MLSLGRFANNLR